MPGIRRFRGDDQGWPELFGKPTRLFRENLAVGCRWLSSTWAQHEISRTPPQTGEFHIQTITNR